VRSYLPEPANTVFVLLYCDLVITGRVGILACLSPGARVRVCVGVCVCARGISKTDAGEVTPWISLLDAADLQTAFARPAAVWGAAGSVLWGSSADTVNETICGVGPGSKSWYVNNR
jgi:hypothetical protein